MRDAISIFPAAVLHPAAFFDISSQMHLNSLVAQTYHESYVLILSLHADIGEIEIGKRRECLETVMENRILVFWF